MARKQRISYVPLANMTPEMRAEMERCARMGTPRPESSAVRAHVPGAFWAFANSWRDIFHTGVCDHAVKELARLYVSRAVTCEFCGNQRSIQAATAGKVNESKVDDLIDFEKSAKYSEREKAALAYAEAITWRLDTDDAFWKRMHQHFAEPELVELGCFIALTMGQQSWLRLLNIEHHEVMAGTSASMAPGFESTEALRKSKASPDYWASKVRMLVLAAITSAAGFSPPADAASAVERYPTKPIRVLVGFPPGGSTDVLTRQIGVRLSEALGQQIIVDNRPAASGILASELVAKGNPDGYTLMMATVASHGINPALYRKVPYNVVRDFAPVTLVATYPLVLAVNPSVPVKSVKDLIGAASAKPGQFRLSSSGTGSPGHLSGEIFKGLAKIEWIHVPYKGGAPANLAVLSGEAHLTFATMPAMIPHVRAGRVIGLAVTTAKRSPAAPELPAVAESLPGFDVSSWAGVVAPTGTPRSIVARLQKETANVISGPELRKQLASEGAEPIGNTPEQFATFIKAELDKWAKAVKQAGAQLD